MNNWRGELAAMNDPITESRLCHYLRLYTATVSLYFCFRVAGFTRNQME